MRCLEKSEGKTSLFSEFFYNGLAVVIFPIKATILFGSQGVLYLHWTFRKGIK